MNSLASCRFLFFEYLSLSIFVYFGILSICITPNMPVAYMISGTVRPKPSVPPSRIPAPFCLSSIPCPLPSPPPLTSCNESISTGPAYLYASCQRFGSCARCCHKCVIRGLAGATVAVPRHQSASLAILQVYFMFSLHCGFVIPQPDYPGWWIWL